MTHETKTAIRCVIVLLCVAAVVVFIKRHDMEDANRWRTALGAEVYEQLLEQGDAEAALALFSAYYTEGTEAVFPLNYRGCRIEDGLLYIQYVLFCDNFDRALPSQVRDSVVFEPVKDWVRLCEEITALCAEHEQTVACRSFPPDTLRIDILIGEKKTVKALLREAGLVSNRIRIIKSKENVPETV